MSIRHAILGFLSWKPFTGYELKKLFADSASFYWSGNSNQIYGALILLHKEGAVSIEIQQQAKYPAKKVYALTDQGREELRTWLLGRPELPDFRDLFHIQLAWAELLDEEEVQALCSSYGELLENEILMRREMERREGEGRGKGPVRSLREALIWRRIAEGRMAALEAELAWTRSLSAELLALKDARTKEEG
jgi:DNA-binding PadR family transcriptional regulator